MRDDYKIDFHGIEIIEKIHAECALSVTLDQKAAKRFFKVSQKSYGADDKFLGITVPHLRKIAKRYKDVSLLAIEELLKSKYNEERLLALLILVHQYQKGSSDCQKEIYQFYLNNLARVNNWNLVDSSAYHILGHHLWDKDRSLLHRFAASNVLWERRIAVVATWYFIRKGDTKSTFAIAKLLLKDEHDLIHKAAGWILREAGKKDQACLLKFLFEHVKQMPKTILRYAMERLSQEQKKAIKN
jgi:3-methyladenine DNA glycosylase AlkD